MADIWSMSSDLGIAKSLQLSTILCFLYGPLTTVESFTPDVARNMHSDLFLEASNEIVPGKNISRQMIWPRVPTIKIPDFKGKSKLHSRCDYVLYTVLHLPIQKYTIGKQRTNDLQLPKEFSATYQEAVMRLDDKSPDLKVDDQICNTEGLEPGFQTPMQCSNITKRCECLVINDLRTVQPLGVVGCLADLGSYCIPGAIECAFGYDCVEGKCAGAIKWIPEANNVVVAIIICIMYDFLS